jgi:hypothetical protein
MTVTGGAYALNGRVLGCDARFAAFPRLLPLIPPAPFSHEGRRGRLGVLMPEMEDGTQGLPKKPAPVRVPHAPITGTCPDHVLCYQKEKVMYNLISALSLRVYIPPFQEFFSLSPLSKEVDKQRSKTA